MAQVSITTADLPHIGTSQTVATSAYPNISVGVASSTAQTWDFFSIISDSVKTVTFADTIGTPSSADYPNATMTRTGSLGDLLGVSLSALGLPVALDNATAYYLVGADGNIYTDGVNVPINIPGLVDLGNQTIAAQPNDIYLPALSFGDSISVSSNYQKDLEITDPLPLTVSLNIDLTRSITADAFGTLILYGRTYEVLRYNETLNAHLSADAGLLGTIDSNITVQTYRFMSPNFGFPVASVSVEELEAGTSATNIEYIFTGELIIGIESLSGEKPLLSAYPNPAKDMFYISLAESANQNTYKAIIYNQLGQIMWQNNFANLNTMPIPTQNWATGLYHCQLIDLQNNSIAAQQRIAITK